jgi:hypothetical protein
MRELAAAARTPGKVFFTGGATALLLGFREQTIDVDIKMAPEPQGVFEAIASLKNSLQINVEMASPIDFIPPRPDWEQRSRLIRVIGPVEFYHFDFALQALAKLERGHSQDLKDVRDLLQGGFVQVAELRETLLQIEPYLVRYPAIDARQFRDKVEEFIERFDNERRHHQRTPG